MNIIHKFDVALPSGKEVKVSLKKPTRREIDEADMVYSAYMSECITRGILTKDMLLKRYKDFGGALSEEEVKDYRKSLKSLVKLNDQLQRAKSAKKKKEIEGEMSVVYDTLQIIEQQQEDLFGRTAEVIARNQTILWLTFLLSLDSKKETPLFEGEDHDERYDSFSKMEEENLDDSQVLVSKICMYVAFWYSNKAIGPEDFDALEKMIEADERVIGEDDAEDSGGD